MSATQNSLLTFPNGILFMASIIERKGPKGSVVYRADIRRKGYKPQFKTFPRKGDADKWARSIEREMDAGTYKDTKGADSLLMTDAIEKYLSEVTPHKKTKTQTSEHLSARYLKKAFNHLTLAKVDSKKVAEYRDNRLSKVSINSVRIELALLSNLFNIASREWGISGLENPVQRIKKPKTPESRCPILTDDQIKRLLDECKKSTSKYLYSFVLLALHTGCRSTELRAVRWTQINIDEGYLRLIASETKGNKTRAVPLTEPAKNILRELSEKAKKDIGIDSNGIPIGVVFPANNNPHKPRDIHKHFGLAVKNAGLDNLPGSGNLRIHDLRHVCATFLLMNDADLETVRDILGHRDLSTTQKYLHVVNEHKKKAIDKIGNLGM